MAGRGGRHRSEGPQARPVASWGERERRLRAELVRARRERRIRPWHATELLQECETAEQRQALVELIVDYVAAGRT